MKKILKILKCFVFHTTNPVTLGMSRDFGSHLFTFKNIINDKKQKTPLKYFYDVIDYYVDYKYSYLFSNIDKYYQSIDIIMDDSCVQDMFTDIYKSIENFLNIEKEFVKDILNFDVVKILKTIDQQLQEESTDQLSFLSKVLSMKYLIIHLYTNQNEEKQYISTFIQTIQGKKINIFSENEIGYKNKALQLINIEYKQEQIAIEIRAPLLETNNEFLIPMLLLSHDISSVRKAKTNKKFYIKNNYELIQELQKNNISIKINLLISDDSLLQSMISSSIDHDFMNQKYDINNITFKLASEKQVEYKMFFTQNIDFPNLLERTNQLIRVIPQLSVIKLVDFDQHIKLHSLENKDNNSLQNYMQRKTKSIEEAGNILHQNFPSVKFFIWDSCNNINIDFVC